MGAAVEAMVAGGGGGAVDAPTPRVQLCRICSPTHPEEATEAVCWAACSAWLVGLTARGGVADGLAAFEGIADSEAEASAAKEAAEKAAAQAAAEKEVAEAEEERPEVRPVPTLPSRRRVAASHKSIAPTLAAPSLAALPTATLPAGASVNVKVPGVATLPADASGAGPLLAGSVATPGTFTFTLGANRGEGPSTAAFGDIAAATVDDAADAGVVTVTTGSAVAVKSCSASPDSRWVGSSGGGGSGGGGGTCVQLGSKDHSGQRGGCGGGGVDVCVPASSGEAPYGTGVGAGRTWTEAGRLPDPSDGTHGLGTPSLGSDGLGTQHSEGTQGLVVLCSTPSVARRRCCCCSSVAPFVPNDWPWTSALSRAAATAPRATAARHGSSGLERASLCARRSPSVSNDKPTGRNETSSAWSI